MCVCRGGSLLPKQFHNEIDFHTALRVNVMSTGICTMSGGLVAVFQNLREIRCLHLQALQ